MTVHQVSGYGDRDGDGDVDTTDKGTPGSTCTTMSGDCRVVDLDFDAADGTLFDTLNAGNARHPARRHSALGNPFGHQGLYYDAEIGSYQNRARQYNPVQKRLMQRDPLGLKPFAGSGYQDGISLFASVQSNPQNRLDPSGEACQCTATAPTAPCFVGTNCGNIKYTTCTIVYCCSWIGGECSARRCTLWRTCTGKQKWKCDCTKSKWRWQWWWQENMYNCNI